MPRLPLLALVLVLAPLAACGPGGEELANATVHTCELRRIEGELRADPTSETLQAELQERVAMLDMVIESSGDPAGLRAELADVACD